MICMITQPHAPNSRSGSHKQVNSPPCHFPGFYVARSYKTTLQGTATDRVVGCTFHGKGLYMNAASFESLTSGAVVSS